MSVMLSEAHNLLRDELAQAMAPVVGRHLCFIGCGPELRQVQWLADAVLVLVEQRIAAERAEWSERCYEHGEDDLHVGYQEGWDAGATAERERIAAKIEALPTTDELQNNTARLASEFRADALRVVRSDE